MSGEVGQIGRSAVLLVEMGQLRETELKAYLPTNSVLTAREMVLNRRHVIFNPALVCAFVDLGS